MTKLKSLLFLIGAVQIILGLLTLFAPSFLFGSMGLSIPADDNHYMLAMLGGRFLAYGFGMFIIMRDPEGNIKWIDNMIFIQIVDLAAGVFYTLGDVVSLGDAAFPMFDATLFIVLLLWLRPKPQITQPETA